MWARRSASPRSAGGAMAPATIRRSLPAVSSMRPKPVRSDPGSMPRMRRLRASVTATGGGLVDVEVRPHVLDVVVVFERLHQAHHLIGLLAVELDVVLRVHAELGMRDLEALGLERLLDRLVGIGRGEDVER